MPACRNISLLFNLCGFLVTHLEWFPNGAFHYDSRVAESVTMPGFTKKYKVHMLVYYELHDTMEQAIHQEKCIKRWKRAWKVRLIEE